MRFVALLAICICTHASIGQVFTWGSASGAWSDPLAWSPTGVPNDSAASAVLAGTMPYTVLFDLEPADLAALSVLNPHATIAFAPSSRLKLPSITLNQGNWVLDSSLGDGRRVLRARQDATIGGGGTIQMRGNTVQSRIESLDGGRITQEVGHTISGSGSISARMTNRGTIDADQPGEVLDVTLTFGVNEGLISATNSGVLSLVSNSGITQSPAGMILADGGTVELGNTIIEGGSLSSTPGSEWVVSGGDIELHGVEMSGSGRVERGATLTMDGSTTFPDHLVFADGEQLGQPAVLRLLETKAIPFDRVSFLRESTIVTVGEGTTAIIPEGMTLRMDYVNVEANLEVHGTLANTSRFDRVHGSVYSDGAISVQPKTNLSILGDLTMSDQGYADLGGGSMFVRGTLTGGLFLLNNGAFDLDRDIPSDTIEGDIVFVGPGTVELSSTLNGTVQFLDGITLSSSLTIPQSFTLEGNGPLRLYYGLYDIQPGAVFTIDPSVTLSGNAEFRGELVNNSTIVADGEEGAMELRGTLINNGTICAEGSGVLKIMGGVPNQPAINNGTIQGIDVFRVDVVSYESEFPIINRGLISVSAEYSNIWNILQEDAGSIQIKGGSANLEIVRGGSITAHPTASVRGPSATGNITLQGTFDFDRSFHGLEGTVINNGRIQISGDVGGIGAAPDVADVLGTGTICTNRYRQRGARISALNIGPDQTVEGLWEFRETVTVNGTLRLFADGIASSGLFGDLVMTESSTLIIEINSLDDPPTMEGRGDLYINGDLEVRSVSGLLPPGAWEVLLVHTDSRIIGTINDVVLPEAPPGYQYLLNRTGSNREATLSLESRCIADPDGNGVSNFLDLFTFLTEFNSQQPGADLAAPFGVWNFFDLGAFLEAFSLGCP